MRTYKTLSLRMKLLISLFLIFIIGFLAYSALASTKPVWVNSEQLSASELILTWNQVSEATGYKIYRSTDTNFQQLIATINDGAITSYTDATISELVIYHYEITAIVNGIESEFSSPLTVRTADVTNPGAVTISAPQKGGNWIDLAWSAPSSPDVHHYEIFRDGVKVGVSDSSTLTYRDLGLAGNTAYSYHVVTVDNSGLKSANSNTLNVTTDVLSAAVKFNETFTTGNTTRWTNNGTNWLSFPEGDAWTGRARWYRSGDKLDPLTANADLNSTYAFSVSEAEINQTFTLTFDYKKGWSNSGNESGRGQDHDLRVFSKNTTSGTWGTAIWQDTTTVSYVESVAQISISFPSAGNYHLRFAGTVATSDRGSDISYIEVDNIRIERPVSPPATPTGEQLSKQDSTRINLSWTLNTEPNLVGYQILRSTDGNVYSLYGTTNTNSFIDPEVPPGNNYYYKIAAVNDAGLESPQSNTVTYYNLNGQIDMTQPDTPTNLTSSSVSSTRIDLVWDTSIATDVNYYIVWMSLDGVTYTNVGQTSSSSHRIENGLVTGQQYTYRVMAVDQSGNYSAGSNHYSVIVPEPDLEAPTTPLDLMASSISETFIELTWTVSTDNIQVDRYDIERLVVDGPPETIKTVLHPNNKVVIDKLTPNTEYTYQVIAYDTSDNPSPPSEALTVTTLADTTPPKITQKKPYEGATGVGTHESILIKFDEEIDPATVTPDSVFVTKTADGTQVFGEISFAAANQIKFSHQGLLANTEYTITLVNTIRNFSSLPLEETVSWSFTTGSSQFQQPHGDYSANTALCKTCHNAHQGESGKMISSKTVYELCYLCHDGTGSTINVKEEFGTPTTARQSLHPIFAPGAVEGTQISCASCHDTHDAGIDLDTGMALPSIPKLITSVNKKIEGETPIIATSGNEFCWNCHGNQNAPDYSHGLLDDVDQEGVNKLKTTTVRVTSSITMQVNTYFTDHQTNFPNNGKGHDFLVSSETNIQCLTCHEKHGSDVAPLLRTSIGANSTDKNGKEFCYQCHQNKVETAYNDYDGMSVNELSGHAQFDCQVCHNPHGSPYPKYLRLPYRMDTSRVSYSASDNALCFDCHDENKLRTMGARQRGDRENFHDFHLRDSGIQATCKTCHRPHGAIAAENFSSVNHKVGFPNNTVSGTREFNLNGGEGTNSGSCALNCHGRDHEYGNNFWYGGALRSSGNWALKDNWQTDSWLLNNRPEIYKTNGSHFRDQGTTPSDGYHWK